MKTRSHGTENFGNRKPKPLPRGIKIDKDTETVIEDAAHIPNRDQIFVASNTLKSQPNPAANDEWGDEWGDSWSGDIEETVKGERDFARDLTDEFSNFGRSREESAPNTGPFRGLFSIHNSVHMTPLNRNLAPSDKSRPHMHAEKLTPEQSTKIRTLLKNRRNELNSVIIDAQAILKEQLSPSDAGDAAVDYNHPADMVSEAGDSDYEKELNLLERQRSELVLVEQALKRLESGAFGYCESCRGKIPFQRLLAVPYAHQCMKCREGELSR